MIKTTVKTILESLPSLQLLADAKLPAKAAYAVSKLAKACASEADDYHAVRNKVFTDAGCVVTEGKYTHENAETLAETIKQAEELSSADVEINALLIDISQFGNAEVPGGVFISLGWALKED